jgi:hypothetical protein
LQFHHIIMSAPAQSDDSTSRAPSSTRSEQALRPTPVIETVEAKEARLLQRQPTNISDPEGQVTTAAENDVFGNEDNAEIHYKTCKW